MYNEYFINSLSLAINYIDLMISKADEQNIRNFQVFYSLRGLLIKAQSLIVIEKNLPVEIKDEWNILYGQIYRALEGTELEHHIDIIGNEINS